MYVNARGLINNHEEIKTITKNLDPIIILASETHLTEDHDNSEVNIKSFNVIRCDSYSTKTGGVAMYIKRNITYKVTHNVVFGKNVWILAIRINHKLFNGNLIVLYHSPSSSDAEFIQYFQSWCQNNLNEDELNIITGDFNLDQLSESFYGNKIKTVINSLGMKQLVKSPTRVVKRSRTLIDYVVSNDYKLKVKVLTDEKVSDHSTIVIDLNQSFEKDNKVEYKTKIVDYSKEQFIDRLLNVNWAESYRLNVNEKAKFFVDNLKDCLSVFIKRVKVKNESNKEWYNSEIKKLRTDRDKAYSRAFFTDSVSDWNSYEILNAKYQNERKLVKNSYYHDKLSKAYGNQKETWKILKEIVNGVKDETKREIAFGDVKMNNDHLIANEFNKFYVNSIDDIIESIPLQDKPDFIKLNRVIKNFEFSYADMDDVLNVLKNIKSKGDCEMINKMILMDAMPIIGLPLLGVINTSLESTCPEDWKNSLVTPIPKVPGTSKGEEFRPVNQLPTYEKILEGIVKKQLNQHTEENAIVIDEQFGFRKGHDCEAALDFLIAQWKWDVDKNKIVIVVFIDLKRAFETIDRNELMRKMEEYGIRGSTRNWFESYLQNRTQCTKYGEAVSDKLPTMHGVPQGSNLSSDLFILYVNDIKSCFKYSKLALFADDTTIYLTCNNVKSGIDRLNEDLERLNRWLNYNKMKLNTNKTKCMIFNDRDNAINTYPVVMNGETIESVDTFKTLGVVLRKDFKMSDHVNYIEKKVAKKIGFSARASRKLTMQSRITIYKTIIAPHFEYCPTILFMCNKEQVHRLQLQQNKAMRIVLKCAKWTSVKLMLDTLCWMSVKQRILYLTLLRIFKLKNGMLPKKLTEMVKLVGDTKKYWLRNEDDFQVIMVKKTSTYNSMMNEGLVCFNKLPSNLKSEKDITKFKRLLVDHIKANVSIY